jgi:peptide/nickel transport system ATP-binding protein
VAVLYGGELVEDAATKDLYSKPLHPYTRGLLDSVPRLGETKHKVQLRAIQGRIPPLGQRPSGCVFRTRCPLAIEICLERPPLYRPSSDRRTRCHRWEEIDKGEVSAKQPPPEAAHAGPDGKVDSPAVLNLHNLEVHFPLGRTVSEVLRREPHRVVRAVDGVNLDISPRTTLGLVGESGSGKTTIARAVTGLETKTDGRMELLSISLPAQLTKRDLDTLRHLQMVFQNPEEALNPYITIGESLRMPLMTLLGKSAKEAHEQVGELLASVKLPLSYAQRMPGQLSGGEKQRVAIARSLVNRPGLVLADEPTGNLDQTTAEEIMFLFSDLHQKMDTTFLIITHDRDIAAHTRKIFTLKDGGLTSYVQH